MTATISIIYFAQLQDDAKTTEESLDISAGSSLNQVFDALNTKHAFTVEKDDLRPTKNHDFVDWDATVADGDVVCYLPPVSGG